MTSNRLTKHLGNAYSERMFCAFFSFSNFLVIIIVLNLLRLVYDCRTITNGLSGMHQTDLSTMMSLKGPKDLNPLAKPFVLRASNEVFLPVGEIGMNDLS